jgi:hypothetical protein
MLESLDSDITPHRRVLKFDEQNLVFPIGRASKSSRKGLVGASDNAWFDNPVMSRNHAELFFDTETRVWFSTMYLPLIGLLD